MTAQKRSGALGKARVPIQVVLGEAEHTLEEIALLRPGSILELTRLAGDPVDVVAAGSPVARGEVVVIDEYFGVRITEILPGTEP